MLRPMREKPFLCHAEFISLSFELKFGIFFVVVMKPIKRHGLTMNFVPIILVRPVCGLAQVDLGKSSESAAFCRLGIQFFSILSHYIHIAMQKSLLLFWLYLVSRVSINLHAIHLLIASSNFTEIDLIH